MNDSDFGLQTGVFTNDVERMKFAFQHLEVGGVMINNIRSFRLDHMPYGGIKDSDLAEKEPNMLWKDSLNLGFLSSNRQLLLAVHLFSFQDLNG